MGINSEAAFDNWNQHSGFERWIDRDLQYTDQTSDHGVFASTNGFLRVWDVVPDSRRNVEDFPYRTWSWNTWSRIEIELIRENKQGKINFLF